MNANEFANAVADRVFTGYASSGPGLRAKIERVVHALIPEYNDPEARLLERKLEIERKAHQGTCALFRVQIARLKLDRSKAKREAADNAVAHDILRLAISEWESRTGEDHATLLMEGRA